MHVCVSVSICTYTCVLISENKWVTRECIHFNSTLWLVTVIEAVMVNTTGPIPKKLINHMEETVNNNNKKYS